MPDLAVAVAIEDCEICEASSAGGEAAGAIRRALKECIRLTLKPRKCMCGNCERDHLTTYT